MRPTGLDIYIYLRKSRVDIEREKQEGGDTLQRHRKHLMEVVRKEGHNLVKEPFEEIVSGEYIIERPEIQKLLKEVEQGAVDAVLVMDHQRLGRGDMFDAGSIYRAFSESDTLVLTPSEVIDPRDESAELMFGIKSIVSREELKSINKRLLNGRKASAKEGKFIGRQAPYGYKVEKETLTLKPDPDTAPIIKIIFELAAEGMGRHKIARHLEEVIKAAPPYKYSFWDQSSLSYMIKNEAYIGTIIWGRTKTYKRSGKRVTKKLPREDWIIKENCHEPLVSKELFKKANEALSSRHRPPLVEGKQLSNPLAGVLKCSICLRSLKQTRTKDRPNPQLRCDNRSCQASQKGVLLPIVYERIIGALEDILSSIEVQSNMIEKREQTLNLIPEMENRIEQAKKDLKKYAVQKDNLHDLLEQGIYTIDVFMERQNKLVDQIKTAELTVENLTKEINKEKEKEKHFKEFLPEAKNVLKEIKNLEDALEINILLKSIVEKILFTRKKEWLKKDEFEIEIYLNI